MSSLSISNNLPIDYESLALLSNNNLGLYSGSNFDLLLSSGALSNGTNISQNFGGSLPPTSAALLGETAHRLTQNALDRYDPISSTYGRGSQYSTSMLPPGLSTMDLLGSIAMNTIPLIKTKGFFGSLFQALPNMFQIFTGGVAALDAMKAIRSAQPIDNHLSPNFREAIEQDNKWEGYDY